MRTPVLIVLGMVGCAWIPASSDPGTDNPATDDTLSEDTGKTPETTATTGTTGDTGTVVEPPCDGTAVCLAAVSGWNGPVAVAAEACPAAYATEADVVHADLTADPAQCLCGCVVSGVTCALWSWDDRLSRADAFTPSGSCDDPPYTDSCLEARPDADCVPNDSETIPEHSWGETARVCEGEVPAETCDGGLCYPAADRHCVVRDGEHDCPAAYSEKSTYFRDATDTRACTECTCEPVDQACTVELEICSVGFFDMTVKSGDALDAHCLNSGDGDSVTLLSSNVDDVGTCDTDGGEATGEAVPTDQVTVCCTP